ATVRQSARSEGTGAVAVRDRPGRCLAQRPDRPPVGRGPQQGRVVPGPGLLRRDHRPDPSPLSRARRRRPAPRQAPRAAVASHPRIPGRDGPGRPDATAGAGLRLQHLERVPAGRPPEEVDRGRLQRRSTASAPESGGVLRPAAQAHHEGQARRGRVRPGEGRTGGPQKGALRPGATEALIYQDEVETNRHPTLCRMWARKGHQPEVPAPGKNEKRVVYGGVDYATGKITYTVAATKSGAHFLAFLMALVAAYAGRKIRLVCDNGR